MPTPEGTNRRAFLKTSIAAVPVILTLRSGAALAATSIAACYYRDEQYASTITIDSNNATDIWMRYPKGNEGGLGDVSAQYTGKLAYFQLNGDTLSAPNQDGNGSPVTGSCYASITGYIRIG